VGSRDDTVIVVLFSTVDRPGVNDEEYGRVSTRMQEIVASIPGFISYNSYVSGDGEELGVVRFDTLEALEAWRTHPEHLEAQEMGRSLDTGGLGAGIVHGSRVSVDARCGLRIRPPGDARRAL
jgi:heme-degrading monooxygenase HmoA